MCKRVEPEFVSSWGNGEGLQLLHQTLYALEEIWGGGGGGGGSFVKSVFVTGGWGGPPLLQLSVPLTDVLHLTVCDS